MLFTIWVIFWNISGLQFFFFGIQNIKSNCCIIFLTFFSIIFFKWKIYFFPILQLPQRIENICYLFYWWDLLLLLFFYKRIYIWSTTVWIYFMTFKIQIKIYFKWFKKLFYNFLSFISYLDFYVSTFWMHYTLFIIIYAKNKAICYC